MSNLFSKICAPRPKLRQFIAATVFSLGLIQGPSFADVQLPDNSAPKVGELAPQFELPKVGNALLNSKNLLSQRAVAYIFDGDTPTQNLNEPVAAAAAKASERGVDVIYVASNPEAGKSFRAPAPIETLRDDSKTLSRAYPSSTFMLVDRAGWIRQTEILPTVAEDKESKALQNLLNTISDPTPKLEVGALAPDFGVKDAFGNWRRVSDLRGKSALVLTFFPKCFTGRCKTHLSSLRDNFGALQTAGAQVWTVSIDEAGGEKGQAAFSKSLGLPFPMLPDPNRNVCLLYKAVENIEQLAIRQTVLIDKNGVVREIDRQIDVESHGPDVLKKISEWK